jgi:hypothetical protein
MRFQGQGRSKLRAGRAELFFRHGQQLPDIRFQFVGLAPLVVKIAGAGQRHQHANPVLLAAARLKERDPHWYEAMQQVAFEEGWENAHARELLDQAVTFEPGYYHYYREYADYLKPQ